MLSAAGYAGYSMAWFLLIVYVLSGAFFIAGLVACSKRKPIDVEMEEWDE